jgi:hypothetical protein
MTGQGLGQTEGPAEISARSGFEGPEEALARLRLDTLDRLQLEALSRLRQEGSFPRKYAAVRSFRAFTALCLALGVSLAVAILPVLVKGGSWGAVVSDDGPIVALAVIAFGLGYYFGNRPSYVVEDLELVERLNREAAEAVLRARTAQSRADAIRQNLEPLRN